MRWMLNVLDQEHWVFVMFQRKPEYSSELLTYLYSIQIASTPRLLVKSRARLRCAATG